ncbi:MAG: tetratricopeptide repeat protein [Myxococcota bacterium]
MSDTSPHRLARWLEDARAGQVSAPPADLEPEVVEAVYALRPDLAPDPELSIDDVLDAVMEGPFAPAAADREALARWLDDGRQPEDLDTDIAETVYALRPDLAPDPELSIADILDGISEGPFAAAPAPTGDSPPEEADGAAVISLASRRRRWSAWSAVGLVAAAALALIIINPISIQPSAPVDLAMDQARYEAAPAATPAPASPMEELQPVRGDRVDGPFQNDAAKAEENTTQATTGRDIARTLSKPASIPASQPAPVREAAERDALSANEDILAEEVRQQFSQFGYLDGAEREEDLDVNLDVNLDVGFDDDEFEAIAPADEEAAPVIDGDALSETIVVGSMATADRALPASENTRRPSRGNGLFGRNRQATTSTEAAAAEPSVSTDVDLDGLGGLLDAVDDAVDDAGDRSGAVSAYKEKAEGRFAVVPSVEDDALAAAIRVIAGGDVDAGLAALEPLRGSSDPDVVLEVAWHRYRLLTQRGDAAGAQDALSEGLQTIGGDAALRARLLYHRGLAYEARGQPDKAAEAYQDAARTR